ncbi:uncharacterized protein LOC124148814 isoform X2 [Haliotis rufescens]|uniref:uncharacterized protein LOC124148814 isoform X2 n=1 Tax=Haliotis rufescens TaxID=6454 RepID=UPI00201EDBDC|nr:uncharacterized protein LOC124148814 isoform X2 [Haliotis rufescens]
MTTEIQEALAYVRQNVSELRNLGKEWGLNDAEIETCVQRAMSMKVDTKELPKKKDRNSQARKFAARETWSRCRWCFNICFRLAGVLFVATTLAAGVMVFQARSFLSYQLMLPYAYNILRAMRLSVSVPLQQAFRIDKYYDWECLIENPMFNDPSKNCINCQEMKTAQEMTATTEFDISMSGPMVFRGAQAPVHLRDVWQVLHKFKDNHMLAKHPLECTADWAQSTRDLARPDLLDKIIQEEKFSCNWESRDHLFQGQLMRSLFPKVSVIPSNSEICIQRNIFIDGTGAQHRKLPGSTCGVYSWYTQGTGTRTLVFRPHQGCVELCQPVSVTVREGDTVLFMTGAMDVEVTDNKGEISISFLGHMLPEMEEMPPLPPQCSA